MATLVLFSNSAVRLVQVCQYVGAVSMLCAV